MIEYEIVDKTDMPSVNKWQSLFKDLEDNKAVKLVFPSKSEAEKCRNTILGSFRYERRVDKYDFHLATRVVILNENEWALFIWKEERQWDVITQTK